MNTNFKEQVVVNREAIEEVSAETGIDKSIIEKDVYVTRVIQTVAKLKFEDINLVFAGGTCLSKAHRLTNRMSEDVDFKLILKNSATALSTSALRKRFSLIRHAIQNSLNSKGFDVQDIHIRARDNGSYTHMEIAYPSYFETIASLRPHVLLELTKTRIQQPDVLLSVSSILYDALGDQVLGKPEKVICISEIETAAEKWVALTRRIAAIARGYNTIDETLVRHLYDLYMIDSKRTLDDTFQALVLPVIKADQAKFKRHIEYVNDPFREIEFSLEVLQQHKIWQSYYNDFLFDMVFDKTALPGYTDVMKTVARLTSLVLDTISV